MAKHKHVETPNFCPSCGMRWDETKQRCACGHTLGRKVDRGQVERGSACSWKGHGSPCGLAAVWYPGSAQDGLCRLHAWMADGYSADEANRMIAAMTGGLGNG